MLLSLTRPKASSPDHTALMHVVRTSPKRGMDHMTSAQNVLLRAARQGGYVCRLMRNASWKDLEQAAACGMVLVRVRDGSTVMHGFVEQLSKRAIVLEDARTGDIVTCSKKEFLSRWSDEPSKGWMMTAMRNER